MTRTDLPELTVGWIGTGHMGAALAARIGRAGLDLTVWNRTRAKAEPLVDAGAKVADEPVELADRDVVFTMVTTSADLEQVVGRLLSDPEKAPRILVDCSTVSTEASARVREVAAQRGIAFLASPVSGNGKVVSAGKLSLVSSGPREAYDEVEPILELLGRHVTYVGDGEKARLVKICHNIMLGVVAQNMAEIVVLAEKGGVPRAAMLDFLAAPVSGNSKVVASGRLTFVVSGPRSTYDKVAHLLGHMGKSVTYVGEGDTARLAKICHNLMLGVVAQTMAEITVLAEKGGMSRAAFLEFLNESVMGSTFTRYKSPAYVHLDYTPTFTPVLLRKDFDLGLAAARELDVPMPLAAVTAQLVQATVSAGRVDEDFAVLLDQQAAASGLELRPEDTPVDDGLGGGPK